MRLPGLAQEIANVIGRDRALYLIGRLPRCYPPSTRSRSGCGAERVILYVPTERRLRPDHQLVRILGWHDAVRLCRHFGGEILHVPNCSEVYRDFRDRSIVRLHAQGLPTRVLAEWFELTPERVRAIVRAIVREIPQEENRPENDNNARVLTNANTQGRVQ